MLETAATRKHFLGMPPARFLRDCWQKRPLLIRSAFPGIRSPLTPNDLAGLACEEPALARMVRHDPKRDRYVLRNGPFAEADFATLPRSHWTLLVQDVDKWDAQVAALLDRFDFVPSWRVDDIMISYAADRGSVGPHVDNYDVFLLQTLGKRRWRISTDPAAPAQFRADAELKLLKRFAPTHTWVLEPGDMLYLPPGVPHHGIAVGACMTCSIGMRAPSIAEMIVDLAETVADPLDEDRRYADPDLTVVADRNFIDPTTVRRIARVLAPLRALDAESLRRWFGRFISRYRTAQAAAPRAVALRTAAVRKRLATGYLARNPWSRFAYSTHGRQADLFVAGTAYRCSPALAKWLCATRENEGAALRSVARSADALALLTQLINAGHLQLRARR